MRIKRFEANDTKTALAMVKQELGDNAVILATRTLTRAECRLRGQQTSTVEVVAAMDYDVETVLDSAPPPVPTGRHADPARDTGADRRPSYDPLAGLRHSDRVTISPGGTTRRPNAAPIREDAVLDRLRPRGNAPAASRTPAEANTDLVARWRDELIRQVRVEPLALPSSGRGPRMIALVGATGVGKTTTAAKIAAWFSIREGRRVALLSMDTYRIGATDQLRTYARIMRLPCEVALRKTDLDRAIQKLAHRDLIIVDTAGKSPYDPGHLTELNDWFGDSPTIEPYLVLSATAKKEDLRHIIRQYEPLAIRGCVLTKLDETRAYANLCQQIAEAGLPVSCLCTGQKVPEDFLLASPSLLRILFGQGWTSFANELSPAGSPYRHPAQATGKTA